MSLDLISVDRSSHADATDFLALLRARRERPCRHRAAERGQEFSSCDVACHVTLRLGSFMQWRDDTTLPSGKADRQVASMLPEDRFGDGLKAIDLRLQKVGRGFVENGRVSGFGAATAPPVGLKHHFRVPWGKNRSPKTGRFRPAARPTPSGKNRSHRSQMSIVSDVSEREWY